ncbi:MAG: DUF1573 domain-containing protein, partial [Sphingobacteriaceae bacterium]
MKKITFILFFAVLASACTTPTAESTKKTVNKATAPIMTFAKESHDFGQVNEGDKVVYDFFFTNTGKSALIISSA